MLTVLYNHPSHTGGGGGGGPFKICESFKYNAWYIKSRHCFKIRIQAFKIRIQAFKIRIQAFKIRIQALKIRIQAFKIRIQAFKIRIQAFKIRIQAFKLCINCYLGFVEEVASRSQIQSAIRQNIVRFLLYCLKLRSPNLSHYLLGFHGRKPIQELTLQDPGRCMSCALNK